MAPRAILSRGNTGERGPAALCCARGAAPAPEEGRILYDLPWFSRVWDRSGGSGPWEDVGVLLSPPQPHYFSVFKTEHGDVVCLPPTLQFQD